MTLPLSLKQKLSAFAAIGLALSSFAFVVSSASAATFFVPESLPNARVSTRYTQEVQSNHPGIGYRWRLLGTLPPGLSGTANVDGTAYKIDGVPTTAGTYTFNLSTTRLSDGGVADAPSGDLTIVVTPEPSGIPMEIYNASTLAAGRVGTAYSVDLLGIGGNAPYRWSLLYGTSLPPGLTLTTAAGTYAGEIRGTPTTAGTYTFGVKFLDTYDNSTTKTFTVTINPRLVFTPPTGITDPIFTTPIALNITTSAVSNGTVGTDYSTTLAANGGTAPYRWNFASGTLPPGLSLSESGVISGRPTAAGTYTAYIEAFDARGTFVGRNFTFSIAAAAVITPLPTLPIGTITPITPVATAELTTRLNNLNRIGVSVHALVKLPDDGNRFTQADSAVYYIGADGRRHAFPNDRVFFTWYGNFDGVRVVSAGDLASIPLGANVTYKPGMKMVKFTTDSHVYVVSNNRTLRWVKTEAAANALYGSNWNRQIDDISDTFYLDYNIGTDVNAASDYDRVGLQSSIRYVSDVLPL